MPDTKSLLGLRTVVYPVTNTDDAKEWYTNALGIEPYFDQPFYVGYNVGGYELGLDPDANDGSPGTTGGTAYWGVADAHATFNRLVESGAATHKHPQEVGDGIVVATVLDPFGNVFGIIENPHFKPE